VLEWAFAPAELAELVEALDHEEDKARALLRTRPDGKLSIAPAGSVVVFSSLTPHRTGPNTSAGVRKAYIIQYAPERARAFPEGEVPALQNDPHRQFPVLQGGEGVEPPQGPSRP